MLPCGLVKYAGQTNVFVYYVIESTWTGIFQISMELCFSIGRYLTNVLLGTSILCNVHKKESD